jgi:hypothetical protein
MKNFLIVIILLVVPAAAGASKDSPTNLSVSFKLRNSQREASGRFVVGNGSQANYVNGGELAKAVQLSQGKGLEYKKHGVIVNCLPILSADGRRANMECQFEISGPGNKNPDLDAWDLVTFQYQSSFTAELGKPLVLVDEPDRRVEITVSLAP